MASRFEGNAVCCDRGGVEATEAVRRRWAEGDADGAYALAVESTHASLSRYLRHLLADDERAREAFQETYLRVFRALGTFRGEATLTTWVLTIGRNVAFNHMRRDQARDARLLPLESTSETAEASFPGESSNREAERLLTRSILDAVDALPAAQREAVLLFYGEDVPLREVARITGRPVNTIKSDLMRARARLREMLQ